MNNIEDLLFFSGKDNYLRVSKGLVRTLGVECAFLFAELVDEFLYYYENKYNSLHENDYWFYSTADNIKERTGWSADKQDRILKELETHGLIIKKVMGIPAKRHFKLCVEKARKLVVDYHETTFRKKRKLDTVENGNLSSEITETNIRNSNQGILTRNFNSKEKTNKKEIPVVKESLTTQKQDGQQNYILNTSRKNVAQKNADFNEFWNEWRAMCKAKGSPTGEKKPAEIEYQKAVKIASHQGIMRTLEAFKDFILLAFENNKHACRWLKNIHWSDFENVIADYKQQAEILKTNLKKQGKPLPIAQKSPEMQQEEVKMKEDTQKKRESVIRHLNGDETQFMNDIKKVLKSYFQALHEPWIDDFVFWIDDFVFSCGNKVAYFGFTEQKHIDTVKRNFEKFEQIITREIASTDLVKEGENLKIELKLID